MSKKTNEEFLLEMKIKNPSVIPLDEYRGRDAYISCQCAKCGNIWKATPRNLLNGTKCNQCANLNRGRKTPWTDELFEKEVEKKAPNILLRDKYEKMNKRIWVKCKICGYEWLARPDHILNGTGCPKCSKSLRKENHSFWREVLQINKEIIPMSDYVNSKTKVFCKCKNCGRQWSAIPNKLLAGTGCPNCDARNKTSFAEQTLYFYLKNKFEDAINRYKLDGTRLELDVYIPSKSIGIEYDGVYWHKSERAKELEYLKYNKCREKKIKLYRIREEENTVSMDADAVVYRKVPYNYKTLDDAIKQIFKLMNIQCDIDSKKDANKIKEQFFVKLKENSVIQKYPLVAEEWNYEKNENLTPDMFSYASNDKVWWKCRKCGREWKAAVCDRTVGGKGCKVCSDKKSASKRRLTNEEFLDKLSKVNPYMQPMEEYRTTHEGIKTKCLKCGYIWYPMPSNSLRGRKCPKCSKSSKKSQKL